MWVFVGFHVIVYFYNVVIISKLYYNLLQLNFYGNIDMDERIYKKYHENYEKRIDIQNNENMWQKTFDWMFDKSMWKYQYNFDWCNFAIVQYPQDIIAFEELIYTVKPDLIIETGISQGGSLIFSASMLAMLEYEEAFENNELLDPKNPRRMVLGVDIKLESHTKKALSESCHSNRIKILEGSSVDASIIKNVHEYSKTFNKVMVFLDSHHRATHVIEELNNYASIVSLGSYCVVGDTITEYMPQGSYISRGWGKGKSPKTAIDIFLKENDSFEIDTKIQNKLLITSCLNGFLKRIK